MRQLFEGAYMLEGEVGGRPLQIMYLRGPDASLLMDTGCAPDPCKFIAPQIRDAGGDPAALTWILNTHPDVDHVGGNHAMKQIAPHAILACGEPDRHICQSLDALMRFRYDVYRADHQIFYGETAFDWLRSNAGDPQPVDATFVGGEHIRLGPGWEIELLPVPGHAKGHLAVHDPKHRALYGADAIHGAGYLGLDGAMKLCPTYAALDDYFGTITLIENLPVSTYVGCHWPVKTDQDIAEFCRQSRHFANLAERYLLQFLDQPRSLREICTSLGPKLGDWPRDTDLELVYALYGHVERLQERGLVQARVRTEQPRVLEYVVRAAA